MPRVTIEVGTREHYSRQVSKATLLLPAKGYVHAGSLSIAGAPAALRRLAEELLQVADETDREG
jgi:hypothetical protein